MDAQRITEMTMQAWDEEENERLATSEEAVTPVTEEEPAPPLEQEPDEQESEEEEPSPEPDEDEPEQEPEREDEADEEEEEQQTEEEIAAAYTSDNPQVQAYLAKYQGDPEKALTAAVHLQQVLGRQGQEKAVLSRRVEELEQQLTQLESFGPKAVLTAEQREWTAQAVESDNPAGYVQQALQAGEFGLARAVCDQWSEASPYEAARAAQAVDAIEWQMTQQPSEQVQFDQGALMGVLVENFPEMPQYEEQMLSTLGTLGDTHPLVQDARSNDPETAARGIIGIFEIARAQTTTVKTARKKLQHDGRQAADDARTRAVVSSAQANPSPGETPRSVRIMPGLTLEELDEAWGSK